MRPLLTRALLATLLSTPQLAAQHIAYAPGSHRYRVVTVADRVAGQGQGGQQSTSTTITQQVTVSVNPHTRDTLQFSVRLDSMKLETTMAVKPPDVEKLQGTTATGVMSPSGKVYSVQQAGNDPDVKSSVQGLTRFLLAFPADAHAGSSWVDTVSSVEQREGSQITTTSIITSKLLGDTAVAGEPAYRLSRTMVLSLTGSATQAGQAMNIEGSGTGDGMYYVSAKGVYLGAKAQQEMHMTINVPGSGVQIPVTQKAQSVTELVR